MSDFQPVIDGFSGFRLIGKGGSAAVYRARQDQLERDVAVKVLRPGVADDRTRTLFDVERKALGRLPKHLNIVSVFGSGFTQSGDPYLSMELCPSGSVGALVKAEGPLSVELATRCGLRVAGALAVSHRLGMIHRDVKPENILISDQGEPVLSDFGIASLLEQESTTTEGAWSPHYVAPELLSKPNPSEVTDLYSLGATIFTLLVGYAPHLAFAGEQLRIEGVLLRVVDPRWVPKIPDSVEAPKELRTLLASLLSKDPRRRVSPAEEVVSAFRRIERALDTENRTAPLPTRDLEDLLQTNRALEDNSDLTHLEKSGKSLGSAISRTFSRNSAKSLTASGQSSSKVESLSQNSFGLAAPPALVEFGFDQDATIVAKRPDASDRRSLEPIPASTSQSEPAPIDRRKFAFSVLFLALLLGIVVGVVALTTNRGKRVGAPVVSNGPGVLAPDAGPVALFAPNDVALRPFDSETEVTWTPNADPGVQYEVELLRDGQVTNVLEVAQPPALVKNLNFSEWLPCFKVNAIDTSTQRVASSETVCISSIPSSPTSQVELTFSEPVPVSTSVGSS